MWQLLGGAVQLLVMGISLTVKEVLTRQKPAPRCLSLSPYLDGGWTRLVKTILPEWEAGPDDI